MPQDKRASGDESIGTVLDAARDLSVQLGELAHNLDVSPAQLVEALDGAQARLNSAYEALATVDNRRGGIFDNQSTGQWWNRRLVSSLPFAVLETDLNGLIVWASETAGALMETSPTRLMGKSIQSKVVEDDRAAINKVFVAESGEAADHVYAEFILPGDRTMHVELIPAMQEQPSRDGARFSWIVQPSPRSGLDGEYGVRVAIAFSQLCSLSLNVDSPQEVLVRVAELTEDVCAPQSSVSVTVGPPAAPAYLAASAKFAQKVDAAQMDAEEGPCQLTWETGNIVYSDDALLDERWPVFVQSAAHTGIVSAFAAPIRAGDELVGVLNVYSRVSTAFGPTEIKVIQMLADAAGAVLRQVTEEGELRELTGQLRTAMESRELIEQAKGIIMARYRCSSEEAFGRLVKVSQHRNIRVRTLAQTLLDSVGTDIDADGTQTGVTP